MSQPTEQHGGSGRVRKIANTSLTRGLRHKEDSASQDEGRQDLDTHRDEPGCAALTVTRTADEIGAVSEPIRYPVDHVMPSAAFDSDLPALATYMIPKVMASC